MNSQQYGDAITALGTAIQKNPNYTNAYIARGGANFGLHKYSEAVSDYQTALQMNTNLATPIYGLGRAYQRLGDKTNACFQYRKYVASTAVDVQPNLKKQAQDQLHRAVRRVAAALLVSEGQIARRRSAIGAAQPLWGRGPVAIDGPRSSQAPGACRPPECVRIDRAGHPAPGRAAVARAPSCPFRDRQASPQRPDPSPCTPGTRGRRRGTEGGAGQRHPRVPVTARRDVGLGTARLHRARRAHLSPRQRRGPPGRHPAPGKPRAVGQLPPGYQDNRLVLLVRDPRTLFAYWDCHPETLRRARQDVPDGEPLLRLVALGGSEPRVVREGRSTSTGPPTTSTTWNRTGTTASSCSCALPPASIGWYCGRRTWRRFRRTGRARGLRIASPRFRSVSRCRPRPCSSRAGRSRDAERRMHTRAYELSCRPARSPTPETSLRPARRASAKGSAAAPGAARS